MQGVESNTYKTPDSAGAGAHPHTVKTDPQLCVEKTPPGVSGRAKIPWPKYVPDHRKKLV